MGAMGHCCAPESGMRTRTAAHAPLPYGPNVRFVAADEPIGDEASRAGRSAEDLAAALGALDEARRLIGRPRTLEGESLESTRIAYEMELSEHRSTTERAHRAELAAKDATIAQQRYEITDLRRCLAESEADAYPPPCPAPGPDRAAAARYSLARRRGLQRGSSRATHRPPQWVAIPHRPQAQA
jgi:hypothetical protein